MRLPLKSDFNLFLILAYPFVLGGMALISLLDGVDYFNELSKIRKELENDEADNFRAPR